MQLIDQIALKENPQMYNYLKDNSYYIKSFNRNLIDTKNFAREMKTKYKERVSDKLTKAVDNMELISSVLDILK